ncbi:putative fatty acyl-CoA reductase CG8306 [Diaphorina citri]|uniref:Fatty acyl-CoA reductase n=1 Tax=Diaphorina citri TaxID=121845 RepID=A0A3Q0IVW7_DIACI|nr:putative fatty acyl-CoA reductase CG8306 [Diaphorina citri]
MYVSTAFSNAYLKTIDEKIYSPPSHYSYLISLTQLGDDEKHTYESAVKSLFEENINTYTMTKAAAEQMIHEEAKDIPAAIFRPSIGEFSETFEFKNPISNLVQS